MAWCNAHVTCLKIIVTSVSRNLSKQYLTTVMASLGADYWGQVAVFGTSHTCSTTVQLFQTMVSQYYCNIHADRFRELLSLLHLFFFFFWCFSRGLFQPPIASSFTFGQSDCMNYCYFISIIRNYKLLSFVVATYDLTQLNYFLYTVDNNF